MNYDINNQKPEGQAEPLASEQTMQNESAAVQQNVTTESTATENTTEETYREPQIPQGVFDLFKKEQEKRQIRKTATVIGAPCLILMLISNFWSYAYFWITGRLGFGEEEALAFASTAVMGQVLQLVLSILMFTVPFVLAIKIAGYQAGEVGFFEKPREKTALPYFLFGVGFCAFANVATAYASSIFQSFGVDYEVDFGDEPQGIFGFLLTAIATAVIPALVEEFACRGIVVGLLKKYGEAFAVVASSIIFGVMHGNFEQIPFAFLVGLVLGFVYIKTGSLWPGVAIHFVNNMISVIFSFLPQNMDMQIQNLIYMVYLVMAMLAAIVGITLISSKGKESFELEKVEMLSSEKQKYKWFFTNVLIIIFIVLNFIEALEYFV